MSSHAKKLNSKCKPYSTKRVRRTERDVCGYYVSKHRLLSCVAALGASPIGAGLLVAARRRVGLRSAAPAEAQAAERKPSRTPSPALDGRLSSAATDKQPEQRRDQTYCEPPPLKVTQAFGWREGGPAEALSVDVAPSAARSRQSE